jgi:hypothetical protein
MQILHGGDHSELLGVEGDNIKIDIKKIGLEGVRWIYLALGRDRC